MANCRAAILAAVPNFGVATARRPQKSDRVKMVMLHARQSRLIMQI